MSAAASQTPVNSRTLRLTGGILALLFYAVHAGVLVYDREPHHLLWVCHLGCLLVGIALLCGRPAVHAVGFFWLCLGVPLWILNVATSRSFMLTSTLTHLGGFAIAVWGLRFTKMPRFSWMAGTLGLVVLGGLSRALTPAHANVNLSHAVWAGWEAHFPSYFWYVSLLLALSAGLFFVLELFVRRRANG